MTEFILILLSTILVNNFVLVQFLGLCPFMGVSGKLETAIGMSMATTFVLTLASILSYMTYQYILLPFDLEFLRTIFFILVIAVVVQFTEMVVHAQRRQEGFLRLREQRGIGGLQAVELGLGWTHARGAPARRRRTLRMGGGSLPLLHRTSCFREATVIGSAIRGWRSGTLTAVAAPACGAAPPRPTRPGLPRRLTYNR